MAEKCKCGRLMAGHPMCEACSVMAGEGHTCKLEAFRGKRLCYMCVQAWKHLDKMMGEPSTWKMFLCPSGMTGKLP